MTRTWGTIGLFGSTFFLFCGLAAGGTPAVDLGILLCIGLTGSALCASFRSVSEWRSRIVSQRLLVLPLTAYLILDVLGFLFSGEFTMLWEKYRVTAPLLALVAAMLLAGQEEAGFDAVFAGASAAALAAVGMTLLRYFGGGKAPLEYLLRFSLRRDYNMYATALLIGWICLTFLLIGKKRFGWALAGAVWILPVLLLSGSRRVLLAVPVVAAAAVGSLLLTSKRELLAKRIAALFVCGIVVFASTMLLTRVLAGLSKNPHAATRVADGTGAGGQTAAAERYETIGHGSMLTKRKVIWGIAIDELSDYSPIQWVIGRGGGENIRLYDRIGEPLDAVYPDRETRRGTLSAHNALLADLLDGGLLKALSLLWLLGACGFGCLRLLCREWHRGLAAGLILGFAVLSDLVSNRYGLLYDRVFLLYYPLLLLEPERKGSYEPSDRDADHPASA